MLFSKRFLHHDAAHGHLIFTIRNLVPLFGQIQRYMHFIILHQNTGYKRLRKNSDLRLSGRHQSRQLTMLAAVLHGYIRSCRQTILFQNIIEHNLRYRSLAGRIYRTSCQIRDAGNRIIRCHNIQNTQRIQRCHLYLSFGLIIQDGGDIGRYRGDIIFSLDDARKNLIRRACQCKLILIL